MQCETGADYPKTASDLGIIPKILHQTWRSSDLPTQFRQWSSAWRALHPKWEYRFYDDAAVYRIVADRAPQWLGTFNALPHAVQRMDLFRYIIIYLDGGLYVDIDTIPFLPNDQLLAGSSCVLGIEFSLKKSERSALGYPWQLANFIFAAAPAHPFMLQLIEQIARNGGKSCNGEDDVENTTGPRMLTRLAFELPASRRGRILVLPQIVWNAPAWACYLRIGPLAQRVHVRHAGVGSWRTKRPRTRGRRLPNPLAGWAELP
jgi:mannosyltransferase OCH1-like enzyme